MTSWEAAGDIARVVTYSLVWGAAVLIGYMRVSKADGSQTPDLQRDALLAAGIEPGHLYEDRATIRAGSVAAPHECRARPAWSRGHSARDRSRDTPADTCAARPVLRHGSVDPHR